jgi:predicted PurR-regulated permease PerM
MDERQVTIDVPTWTVVKVIALAAAAYALWHILGDARQVLTWLGISFFLAVALNPIVVVFERWMSRSWAVATVFLLLLLALAGFIALLVIPLAGQIDHLQRAAPGYIDQLRHDSTIRQLNERYAVIQKAQEAAREVSPKAFGALTAVATGIAAVVTVLFLTLFLLLELPGLSRGVLDLLEPATAARVRSISIDVNRKVGGYVLGNVVISIIAGFVVGVSLWVLGVPYAAALAVFMGFFDLVPLVGATIGALAAIGVAFATQGVTAGIVMIVVNVVYQQVENHVLQPVVYRRTVELSAYLVLVAVLIGAALLGFVGALVAIPVAGSIQVIVRELLSGRAPAPGQPPPPAAAPSPEARG